MIGKRATRLGNRKEAKWFCENFIYRKVQNRVWVVFWVVMYSTSKKYGLKLFKNHQIIAISSPFSFFISACCWSCYFSSSKQANFWLTEGISVKLLRNFMYVFSLLLRVSSVLSESFGKYLPAHRTHFSFIFTGRTEWEGNYRKLGLFI